MADLDDMEIVECPVCKRKCPKEFYPVCSCSPQRIRPVANESSRKDKQKAKKPKKTGRR